MAGSAAVGPLARARTEGPAGGYRGGMGVFGEMFGKKLTDESGEDSDGQTHRPRLELDLDGGVIRLSGPAPRAAEDSSGDR